ncbi:MAG: S41 family peptidase [Bacteroidales bacterium]
MKKFLWIIPFLYISIGFSNIHADENDQFLRYPALNKDGSKIAFSYQGDIWVKSLEDNSNANRITVNEAYEHTPVWSPDDEQIAFSSNRYGHNDVFVMESTGGSPKRLTHHSTSDVASDWISDNKVLFTTERAFVQVEREKEIYQVSMQGETPRRVMDAVGYSPVLSPNKRFIAFVRGSCKTDREDYKGPANRDIWIYDKENDEYHQITEFEGNDFKPKWAGSNSIYFISSRSGKYNIHKVDLDNDGKKKGEIEEITNHTEDGIRHFDVNDDGSVITYEKDTNIYVKKEEQQEATPLSLNLTKDDRHAPVQYKTYSKDISEYEISPSGKYTAFVIRGEIFLINNESERNKTVRLTDHPYRDHDIDWVNDSSLVFISDREGQKEIYLLKSKDERTGDLYKALKFNKIRLTQTEVGERSLNVSPDGNKISFIRDDNKFIVADIDPESEELNNENILRDGWAMPSGVAWSPDSKWLAYSLQDLNFNSEIYIHAADDNQEPVNVSMHPKRDFDPYWSPDGKKLGFISQRNNGDADLWFAWLKKEDWERTPNEWEELEEEEDEEKEKEDDVTVEIDTENIHERLRQVTGLPGNESDIAISKDGKTFYFVANSGGRRNYQADEDLYSINWDGKNMQRLTENDQKPNAVKVDHNNNKIYMIKKGRALAKMDTKSNGKLKPVSVKAEMKIRYKEELEQIFEEAWSILEKGFYDPDFHENDWTALKKKFKPYALSASTKKDFRDMFNVMLGQLNASHMGLSGRNMEDTEQERTGYLGVEVEPHPNGALVTHVIPNSPADRSASKIKEGEIITNIDGERIEENSNIYAHLTNKRKKEVYIKVRDDDGNSREITIRPTNSLRREKYDEWVEERKRLTEKYSDGKLGYIHIQGMNWPSFERFERELTANGKGKEGIVIDVRFNGGGWTTDYLMTVLNVKQHSYTIPRGATDNLEENHEKFSEYYPFSDRLPLTAWTKPSIALCNQNSYSNAEIFSHAYKTLDVGTLVGTPTFGAVISTGGRGLIDDSYVRLPYRAWYVKETKENMENGPAVPDILIDNKPDSKANDRDEQLKKAVDELLDQIEE